MKCNFKTSVRIFSAFMAVLLLFSALSLQVIADTTIEEDKDTYKDLENQLAEIRRSKNNITASIAEAKNKKDSAIEVKNLLDRELYLIGEEISTINLLIAEYEGRVLEIENEIMALEEEMYASYNKLMDRLVVIYENGDAELIDFLLSSGNFAEFLSRIEYTTDLISFNKGILDKLQMDKDELEAKKMLRESAADSVADMLEKSIES